MGENNKQTYYELLKHPKWQEKRLVVLKIANFTCESCGEKEKTLHVHHAFYKKGLKPWEYPNTSLHCLCEKCHKIAKEFQEELYEQIGNLLPEDMEYLRGYVKGMALGNYPNQEIQIHSIPEMKGLATSWEIEDVDILLKNLDVIITGYDMSLLKKQICKGQSSDK